MEQKTVTEKRFGEYHIDDLAVSIRAKSASCGGGAARYSSYPISANHRSVVLHRLQMGATGTSCSRKIDN